MLGSDSFIFRENASGGLDFVGEFDRYYKEVADPWSQSGDDLDYNAYYAHSRLRLMKSVRPHAQRMGDFCGLEVGCGHGHVTNLLAYPGKPWDGMDISPTAVQRASVLYPQHRFFAGDLTNPDLMPNGPHDNEDHLTEQYAIVVLGQVWWYLLHDLDLALDNCRRLLRPGGILVVSQAFLEKQRYGASVANGFVGALRLFLEPENAERWQLIEAHYDDKSPGTYYDGLIMLRKT